MKLKLTAIIAGLAISFNAYSQFFDTVPYVGAFGAQGSTRPAVTGYNPDPTNTNADWTTGWSNFTPNATLYPGDAGWVPTAAHPATNANKVSVSGDISVNTTWTKNNWYEVSGTVHILNGATLTIEPGTVIRGNVNNTFVLLVAKGGKLNAIGTLQQPIVMTSGRTAGSRVRGDWGGVLLIGNAHTNTANGVRQYEALPSDPLALYGGGPNYNDADNSGTLRYLRIEYAGYNFLPDQEINGLTFAGVGYGTRADYIQVSFANDDSYEWFGGASNHKYLISFAGTDDDFDMDEGYNGKCQFLLGVRNPAVFETSPSGTSNGLEHDNNTGLGSAGQVTPGVNAPEPKTAPVISNMTLLGPIRAGENRNTLATTARARFGRALELRTNVSTSVFNSLIGGYPEGMRMVHPNVAIQPSVQQRALNDEMTIRNSVLASAITTDVLYSATNTPTGVTFNVANWWFGGATPGFTTSGNDTANTIAKFGILAPSYTGSAGGALNQINFSAVNYMLSSNSPYKEAARFNTAKIPTIAQPTVALNPSVLPIFNQIVGTPSPVQAIVLTAANLAGNINATVGTNFEVSLSRTAGWASNVTKNGPSANDTIFVRYNRTNAGSNTAFLTVSSSISSDFTPLNINLAGSATAPASPLFGVDKSTVSFSTTTGTASAEKLVNVSGRFLVGNNISVTASANFEVSTTTGSGFASTATITGAASVNLPLYVRFVPTGSSAATGTITLSTNGVDDVIINVSGSVTGLASVTVSPTSYPQWQVATLTNSLAYPLTITGANLTGDLKVKAPNANFKLSTDSAFTNPEDSIMLTPASGAVAARKVYVRFQAPAASASTGNVAVSATGATTVNSAVSGLSVAANARRIIVANAPSNSITMETVFGTPSASRSLTVAGANLTDRLTVAYGTEGFQVSVDNTNWLSSLTIDTIAGGNINPTPIWVRYNPSVIGTSGAQQLILSSTGATTININVSGLSIPLVTAAPATLPEFATVVGVPSYTSTIDVSGVRLLAGVIVNVTPNSGFEVSTNASSGFGESVSIPKSGSALAATPVYFRYNPKVAGSVTATASFSTQSGPSSLITLNGFAVELPAPSLSLSTASISFDTTSNTPTPTTAKTFTVNATNLRDSLSVTVGGDFELSPDNTTWKKDWKLAGDVNGAIANLTLYCRFNRTTAGTSTSTIDFKSEALAAQKIAVSGTLTLVGLKELYNNISTFTMFPNPAQNEVVLDFTLDKAAEMSISVIDVTGKVVKEVSAVKFLSGSNTTTIDASDLNNGFYFVNIHSSEGSKTTRLMIAK